LQASASNLEIATTGATSATFVDIPLEGFGDQTKMLWGPNKWIAVTDSAGVPLTGTNGLPLAIPAYEIPA
jgi:hypothetical protein